MTPPSQGSSSEKYRRLQTSYLLETDYLTSAYLRLPLVFGNTLLLPQSH